MTLRESLDPDRSLWDLIAVELRRQRELHRFSGSRLGALLSVDRSTVSRYESGMLKLPEKHAKIIDREWGLERLLTRLVRFARAGHDADWFQQHLDYEARATVIRIFELAFIPGLLQTPDYARALLTAGRDKDVEGSLAARLARQEILARPQPPEVFVLLDETVLLRTAIGGPKVMRAQLAHLLKIGGLPHVTVRIVPLSVGAHGGLEGSFKVLTVREGDVAYMDACGGGRLSLDPSEVSNYSIRYDRIGVEALSREESRRLIMNMLETSDDGVAQVQP